MRARSSTPGAVTTAGKVRNFGVNGFTAYVDSRFNTRVHHNTPHDHDPYFELLYFIEGSSRILVGGREHSAQAGDLVVYYPWVEHEEFVSAGRFRIICLRFEPRDIPLGVPFPGPDTLQPVFHLPWKERFRNVFEQIVIENRSTDHYSEVMRGTYLTQFVVLLWRALTEVRGGGDGADAAKRMRVGTVLDLIHSGMRSDLSLSELAQRAFMSESHFSHVFKDVTGVPPKRYVIENRIARAREMLGNGTASVVDIAAELGFRDSQYFCRLFKKQTGQTPMQYRRGASGRS